jgi:CubicO group peptidase (beta-lactamase class C family)
MEGRCWAWEHDAVIAMLVGRAGYRFDEPVVVGLQRGSAPPMFFAQGTTKAGKPLTAATLVYTASLSKQLTAACAALLAADGVLDTGSPLSRWMPELPPWAHAIRLEHLVYHIAGLPDDADIDAVLTGQRDRTTAAVIAALKGLPFLPRRPGSEYAYSNAGYVCLAVVVERAAGQMLPDFARHHVFSPLGMHHTFFWPGPEPVPAGGAPLVPLHPAPLSLGDGGVWSTATDLIRWNQAMNADALGISARLQTPGCLDDGTQLDYGWGIGIRTHRRRRVYRHGGGWPGLRLLLARIPELQASFVIVALADDTERRVALADALLDHISDGYRPSAADRLGRVVHETRS